MSGNEGHRLKKFFIQVNSSPKHRLQFLENPIPYIQEALPQLDLTPEMKKDIEEIREKLVKVKGVSAIAPGIKGMIDNLKKGTDLPKDMEDDSVVC